ncbi:DNA-binding transcriptional regulator, LysR family [Variovorax sp. HW608]|uniref:LysR family transcriptional regulator n=1 Tax=Variovorax sp. HW608 TaxID=1034889 RepID=UPI00081FD213|nr:LysR family transcriptional regulator [Variovorax sp. HW608]SCK28862.1 DNA-binding transcriptional regulator, LysR family [Variovorax sp. HW608]
MAIPEHLNGIATFVAAARAGSFTAAGEKLGISKSAVGKAVARLEERLGSRLFHRSTRKLSLTTDGELYFATCSAALADIAGMEDALQSGHQTLAGRLRVDLPAAFGRAVVMPILLEIARKHPGLRLTVSFTDRVIDPIEEGVDLVIRFGPLKDSSGLVARRLSQHKLVICAAPEYLQRKGVPQSIEDLAHHNCIVGQRSGQPLAWVAVGGNDKGQVQRFAPPPTYEIGDGDAMVAAAIAGCGLCQVPEFMVRAALATGELVSVLAEASDVKVDVSAVWPATRGPIPRVRRVIDELASRAARGELD